MRMIGIALVSILATLAVVALGPRQELSGTASDLEEEGRAALDAIATLLMIADAGSVQVISPALMGSTRIEFQLEGYDNAISFEERGEQCRATWGELKLCDVSPYCEGEKPNGMDDNGNGLIDERGLAFALDQGSLMIALTIQGRVNGQQQEHTLQTTVTLAPLEEEG